MGGAGYFAGLLELKDHLVCHRKAGVAKVAEGL